VLYNINKQQLQFYFQGYWCSSWTCLRGWKLLGYRQEHAGIDPVPGDFKRERNYFVYRHAQMGHCWMHTLWIRGEHNKQKKCSWQRLTSYSDTYYVT